MEVNFNNLRKKACRAHDRLVQKLNNAVDDDNMLHINCDDIQSDMAELKQLIGSIAMCYLEGNPEVADVFSEVYPEDEAMADFNSEF